MGRWDEKPRIDVLAFAVDEIANSLAQYDDVKVTPSSPASPHRREGEARSAVKFLELRRRIARTCCFYTALRDSWLLLHLGFWRQKLREMREWDLLLIGGGNLLMDLHPSWVIYVVIYAILARIAGVPLMFYAVGAGPIDTMRGKVYLKLAVRLAQAITVRDAESAQLLTAKHITDKAIVSADPALALTAGPRNPASHAQRTEEPPLRIGLTVVPYHDPRYWPGARDVVYREYVESMAHVIDCIIEQRGCETVLFATNYPADLHTAMDISDRVRDKSRCVVVTRRLGVREVIEIAAECDLVIGTRLHSLILSCVAMVPFIGIAYQPKVRAFCRSLGLGAVAVDLSPEQPRVDPVLIADRIDFVVAHRQEVVELVEKNVARLRELADLSAEMALRLAGGGE